MVTGKKTWDSPLCDASVSGPDHDRMFEIEVHLNGKVYGHGNGRNKQIAERLAAQATLDIIENTES
jgi:dsRNA-specific ribonuclease